MNFCKYCKKPYNRDLISSKKFPKDFCCIGCYEQWRKLNETPNTRCACCGKPIYVKPYRLSRLKNGKIQLHAVKNVVIN